MFCGNCGYKNDEGAKFCGECGFLLEKESVAVKPEELKKAEVFPSIIDDKVLVNSNINKANISLISNQDNPNTPNMPVYNGNYKSNYHNVNKKKSPLKSVLLSALVLILLVTATIVFINRDTIFSKLSGKRTIMLYMVGSDLESKYLSASKDIKEMVDSNADFNNINLLIYTGGSKNWHREEISSDENAIFKVTSDGLEKLKSFPIKDMGDYETLLEFLEYGYDNYKAANYSLILWDHGGGPIYGYGYDEYNKLNSLSLLELKQALESSSFNASNKLEFIGFDACLMATAEIAYTMSDYAEYMIASQEVEPGDGWNYSFLENIQRNTKTNEIGKSIIDSYKQYYSNRLNGKGISLSLLRLNKMDAFEKSLDSLFQDVDKNLVIDFSDISRSRSDSKTFGKVTSTGYDLVDLYDLLDKLPNNYYEKVNNLKSVIEDLVIYQTTDLTGANGISIYFPYDNKSQIDKIIYLYQNFSFAESYTNFLDNFTSELTGTRLYNWDLENRVPVAKGNGVVEVQLPEEVAENYSEASYVIFEKVDNDYYIPRFRGTDVKVEGTTLSTTIERKALVATDSKGKETYITALEAEKGKDYIKYIIPGTIQNWSDDLISDFEILPVYLQLVVDENNPNGKISGAIEVKAEEENLVSPKVTIDINDWKIIQLLNYRYKIFDELGNYTANWTASGEITGFEAEITEGFKLEFKDLDASKEYYCLFRIADSQGNLYTTNVVKIINN